MLEKVGDFVYDGIHVRLYEGLEPVTVGTDKRLVFERHVFLNEKEAGDLLRCGTVENWAQEVREEIDRRVTGNILHDAVRH